MECHNRTAKESEGDTVSKPIKFVPPLTPEQQFIVNHIVRFSLAEYRAGRKPVAELEADIAARIAALPTTPKEESTADEPQQP